ncbi:MAG: tRNA (adenosine(37)-N6)-threonylcarbamoyltransferase complex dimerization subunit type 1 TsaB [Pantoea sp. Brub]|nr:tRNA (adenosine(37)-N6)-threonylcarbamoyltransferase complex dimerization subunit type 1 TsaB [Pantoea sp. Brub]
MSICILAINTVTELCSISLLKEHKISTYQETTKNNHSNRILILINDLLKQNKIDLMEIDLLAFSYGPGNFTGIRIATGIAYSLAFGLSLKIVGISTLEILAQGVWRINKGTHVLTALDARIGKIYWGEYQRNEKGVWVNKINDCMLTPCDAIQRMRQIKKQRNTNNSWITSGNGWKINPILYTGHLLSLYASDISLPFSEDMLPLAQRALKQNKIIQVETANPIYLCN